MTSSPLLIHSNPSPVWRYDRSVRATSSPQLCWQGQPRSTLELWVGSWLGNRVILINAGFVNCLVRLILGVTFVGSLVRYVDLYPRVVNFWRNLVKLSVCFLDFNEGCGDRPVWVQGWDFACLVDRQWGSRPKLVDSWPYCHTSIQFLLVKVWVRWGHGRPLRLLLAIVLVVGILWAFWDHADSSFESRVLIVLVLIGIVLDWCVGWFLALMFQSNLLRVVWSILEISRRVNISFRIGSDRN